jgi:hypothetical protein
MENSQFQNIDNHDIDSQHVNNLTPLGIQNPLFSSPPLGQSFLSTKFISPLGRQSLSNIDTLGLLRQENLDYNLPNQSIQTFTNSEVVEEEIPSVQASINSVEEIPAIQTSINSVEEIPAIQTSINSEVVEEIPAVQTFRNSEVVEEEIPSVQTFTNSEAVGEIPAVQTFRNSEVVEEEIPSVQTSINSEVVEEEIPSVQTSINSVGEIPSVQTSINSEVVEEEIPSVQTSINSEVVEEEIPAVQTFTNSEEATEENSPIQTFRNSEVVEEEIPAIQSFRNSEVVEEKAISPLPTTIENLVSTKPLGSSNLLIPEYNLLTSNLSYKPLQNIRTNIQTKREIQPSYSSENNLLINAKNNLINSEFIHNNTPFNIQKKSKNINQQSNEQLQQPINTTKIPESWSSLEELVGNNSNQVNTETSNIQMSSLPTQERENLINIDTEYYNNYYTNSNVSSGIESLVQMSRTASEEATNTNQTESSSNTSVKGDSEDNSKDADSKNFEILAREIYAFIRQRLEIERERGRNYY